MFCKEVKNRNKKAQKQYDKCVHIIPIFKKGHFLIL